MPDQEKLRAYKTRLKNHSNKQTMLQKGNRAFLRSEHEDDDGYDPYSDRLPEEEQMQSNPWN